MSFAKRSGESVDSSSSPAIARLTQQEETACLFYSVRDNNPDRLFRLLALGADPNVFRSSDERHTPLLTYAINTDSSECVDVLLAWDDIDINMPNAQGISALHESAFRGYAFYVTSLLSYGADPNVADMTGETPLHKVVCRSNDTNCLNLLLEAGANPNAQTVGGYTVLFYAVVGKESYFVKKLLEFGADPNIKSDDHRTPLFAAVRAEDHECISLLLDANADPNIQDNNGDTVLFKAIKTKSAEWLKMLLVAGANPSLKNKNGDTISDVLMRDQQAGSSSREKHIQILRAAGVEEAGPH